MSRPPRIKAVILAFGITFVVLGVYIFAYYQLSEERDATRAQNDLSMNPVGEFNDSNEENELDFEDMNSENDLEDSENISNEVDEDTAEIMIYGTDTSILSLDLSSQFTTDLSALTSLNNEYNFRFPKFSPDGKKIAFYMWPRSNDRGYQRGIYVMNSDGSNMRLIESSIFSFNFGPDGNSIVHVSANGREIQQVNLDSEDEPLVHKTIESIEENKFATIQAISCRFNYLYWIINMRSRGYEIRRKNMTDPLLESELLYAEETPAAIVNLSVSPDGNLLLIGKKAAWTSQYRIFAVNIQNEIFALRFELGENTKIDNFSWSLDGKWIYAERTGGTEPGLVRFDTDAIYSVDPIEFELIIPDFKSYSGVTFVSRSPK